MSRKGEEKGVSRKEQGKGGVGKGGLMKQERGGEDVKAKMNVR